MQEESTQPLKPDNQDQPVKKQESLVKEFPKKEKGSNAKILLIVFVILIAGIGTGYLLSSRQGKSLGGLRQTESINAEGLKAGDVFGVPDESTFRDEVEGILVKGGIDGEGSHHLMRPGGESQNVYLTSSIVDLDKFVDHKIKIWGETFAAQKAGWLMDVGRVEVLELNAEKPSE